MDIAISGSSLAHRVKRLGHLDLPGGGQGVVQGRGHYIPAPCGGFDSPQTNDVEIDARGLIYIVDRYCGFDVLEFQP